MIRVAVAEARRFPDLATSVNCMGPQRQTEAVARLFGEFAAFQRYGLSPAFTADNLMETARHFLDLVVLPMLMRALFGEDLTALRAEIESHASRAVAFFLAACGLWGGSRPRVYPAGSSPSEGMTTPEFGSIQAMWSWTATQPGVFSAITLSAPRNRSSMIEPVKVTAPF